MSLQKMPKAVARKILRENLHTAESILEALYLRNKNQIETATNSKTMEALHSYRFLYKVAPGRKPFTYFTIPELSPIIDVLDLQPKVQKSLCISESANKANSFITVTCKIIPTSYASGGKYPIKGLYKTPRGMFHKYVSIVTSYTPSLQFRVPLCISPRIWCCRDRFVSGHITKVIHSIPYPAWVAYMNFTGKPTLGDSEELLTKTLRRLYSIVKKQKIIVAESSPISQGMLWDTERRLASIIGDLDVG